MESIRALAFGCTFALGNSTVRADKHLPRTKVDCDAARHDVSGDGGGLVDDDHSRSRAVVDRAHRQAPYQAWRTGWRIAAHCRRYRLGHPLRREGPRAWAMQLQRARELRNQCTGAGVPSPLRRWGEFMPKSNASLTEPSVNPDVLSRIGKKSAGHLPDGIKHNGFPDLPG